MIERNVRNLLLAIGIGRTQANMVTPNMYQAPAVTDPKSAHIMLVVRQLQECLNTMGYRLVTTGYLDLPTAKAMADIVGPGWERRTWAENIAAVIAAKRSGKAFAKIDQAMAPDPADVALADAPLSGMPLGLPDVPGGIVTYAVAGFLVWRHLSKKRGSK